MFVVIEVRYPYANTAGCKGVYGPFETETEAREWRKAKHVEVNHRGEVFNAWNVYHITSPNLWSSKYNGIIDHSGEGTDKVALHKKAGKKGYTGICEPACPPGPGQEVQRVSVTKKLEEIEHRLTKLEDKQDQTIGTTYSPNNDPNDHACCKCGKETGVSVSFEYSSVTCTKCVEDQEK